jgi:hypothetical protein
MGRDRLEYRKPDPLSRDTSEVGIPTSLAGLADDRGKESTMTPAYLLHRLVEFQEECWATQLAKGFLLSVPQARGLKLLCCDWAAESDGHSRRGRNRTSWWLCGILPTWPQAALCGSRERRGWVG